jgi:hypothetical protein
MPNPYEIYDLLQDYAADAMPVQEIIVGLVWTACITEFPATGFGLAMRPGIPTRTLPWAGTLSGKPVAELVGWVRDFEPYRATVGMAAVNAGINRRHLPAEGITLEPVQTPSPQPSFDAAQDRSPTGERGLLSGNNLAVFEHFLPEIRDRRVAVIGRYPGLDNFAAQHGLNLTVLERQPSHGDLPDTAAEYLLPEAEWVFITASSIPNKTFPRLAELSRHATTVLMGPTTPWLPELKHFGIDYLAGVEVADPDALRQTVAEGGGVRIFDEGVRYRVAPLTPAATQEWTRQHIARTVQEKEALKLQMERWYESGQRGRFPDYGWLEKVNIRLSRLDTCFKRLWDEDKAA